MAKSGKPPLTNLFEEFLAKELWNTLAFDDVFRNCYFYSRFIEMEFENPLEAFSLAFLNENVVFLELPNFAYIGLVKLLEKVFLS